MVTLTADLLVETLSRMRDANLLDVTLLEALVVDPPKYESPSQAAMFRPISDAILNAIQTEPLIPSFRGGYAAGVDSRLAYAAGLRPLLSPSQLRELVGSEDKVRWVVEDITRDRTPSLHTFLSDSVGVESIHTEDFLRMVTDSFLAEQSDAWTTRFYQFLAGQPAARNQPSFLEKALVRLQDGTHVRPFDGDGKPNAYLPGDLSTEFPTVKRQVCQNRDALRFLRAIGLRDPDSIDDVFHNLIPRYQEVSYEVPPQYAKDLQRIVAAYTTDSTSQREKLLGQLQRACWIPCRNAATGKLALGTADNNTYFATPELQKLFSGNADVWFADCTYRPLRKKAAKTLLLSCGVGQFLQSNPISCSFTEEDLRRIRLRQV